MKIVIGAFVILKAEKISVNLYMLKGETQRKASACVTSTNKGKKLTMI